MTELSKPDLFLACRSGDVGVVKRLLPRTSPKFLNTLGPDGETCLHAASANGHVEIVRHLLRHGASRRIRNKDDLIPIDVSKTPEVAALFYRPEEATRKRYGSNPVQQLEWVLDNDYAESLARAMTRSRIKDRGIAKTVKKMKTCPVVGGDQSEESEIILFYLNEALEKNDPTYLLRIYTLEGPFYDFFNRYMASSSRGKIFKRLCHKWHGYYTGIIMKNPALNRYRFAGTTFRGMQIPVEDLGHYKVGTALCNKAFQSTSKSLNVALGFAEGRGPRLGAVSMVIIYTIIDSRSALDISSLSEYPDEEEVLLVPGTCFQVAQVKNTEQRCETYLRQISFYDE